MPKPLQMEFVRSATKVGDLPQSRAEVALVGRSNVGKSSLVNALANHNKLANVSNTPGRTQLINMFRTPDGATLVDLPGYGYAAVPGRVQATWQAMIEGYLLGRECLAQVFVLVDGEIGPTKLDLQMLEWLRGHGLGHTVVATKLDKVKPTKRPGRRRDLARACRLEQGDIIWTSASKREGIDELRALIALHLAA